MQSRREGIDKLNPMGVPTTGDLRPSGMMPMHMPSLFGGRDPFDDPFFTRPLGQIFHRDHDADLFQPRTSATAHAARSTGSKDLVIEELASDDDVEEKQAGLIHHRDNANDSGKHPSVEHPDDDPDERNDKAVSRGSNHAGNRSNRTRSHGFSYSKVTYGGADGAYYTSTRSRHVGGDGAMIEESKEADKTTGQATHRVSRGIDDKGHSVTRKLNPDGKVDTVQTLHNLDEGDLAGFEESWKGNFGGTHLPSFINQFGMNGASDSQRSRSSEPREMVSWGDMANPFMVPAFGSGGRGSKVGYGSDSASSDGRSKKVVRINIE